MDKIVFFFFSFILFFLKITDEIFTVQNSKMSKEKNAKFSLFVIFFMFFFDFLFLKKRDFVPSLLKKKFI